MSTRDNYCSYKYIEEKIGLENVHDGNRALAHYVLVKAYLKIKDLEEARKCFVDLKKCDDCFDYVESIKNEFGE